MSYLWSRLVRNQTSLHHTLMAGAMIWMTVVMPAGIRIGPAMPAGGGAMSQPAGDGGGASLVVAVVLAVYFVLAALLWLARVTRSERSTRGARATATASAAMAAMLLKMFW